MGKEFSVLIVGRAAQAFITVALFRLMTSLLPPAEVGNYFLILSIVGFCSLTLVSPFGMYINRRFHAWEKDGSLLRRLAAGNFYLVGVAFFSALCVLILNRFWGVGNSIPLVWFMFLAGLYTYVSTCNQTIIPSLNMLGLRGSFVAFTLATLTAGLVFSAAFALYGARTAVAWLSGQTLAMGLLAFVALFYLRGKMPSRGGGAVLPAALSAAQLAPVLSFAWPLSITYFFMWGQNMSHRLIIEKTIGPEFLGLIGVGLGIAAGMAAAVESVAQQFYLPLFYREISGGDQAARAAAWNKMARITLPLYLAFSIMVSCTAPFILKLLAGARFNHAYLFLICGAWVEFFRMTTNVLANVAHAEMRTGHLVKSYLTGAVIAVAGTVYSAARPDYETLIPAILVLSGSAMCVVMAFDMKKLMRFRVFTRELAVSFLMSIPFAAAALFYGFRENLWASGSVCAAAGIYFAASQYFLARRVKARWEGVAPVAEKVQNIA